MESKDQAERNIYDEKGHVKIDWVRQGGVILCYILALLGYYEIITNTMMLDQYGDWISYTDMDKTILLWTFTTYLRSYFLPVLLLSFICFALAFKEDILQYGIKTSIWLVPLIIIEGFIFYDIMFGFSVDPFILKFGRIEGYIDMVILFGVAIFGALSDKKLKQYVEQRKSI
jgi:hypothetical protein